MQDLRFTLRGWRKNPGFALMAVLILALGIGFSTSMFSLVDGLWLERYPFPEAEELLVLSGTNPESDIDESGISYADATDLRTSSRSLEDLALVWSLSRSLTGGENARQVKTVGTTPNLFSILGAEMQHGRGFTDEEAAFGAGRVVVLSDHLWRRQFGGDPSLVGQTIEIDGEATTLVGILAVGAQYPDTDNADMFMPLGRDPRRMPRQGRPFTGIARLADGVSLEAAQAELDIQMTALEADNPMSNRGWRVRALPLREFRTRDFQPLLPLVFLIGLILVIGCANVGNLLLQRAAQRTGEMAVRSAHGASRGRLVRLLWVESGALAVVSAAAGIAIAFLLLRLTVQLVPVALPSTLDVQLDGRAILFAFLVALITTGLAGLAPVLFSSSRNPARDLAAQRTSSGDKRSRRLADGFLVLQVALALVLVVGALLTVRSFDRLNRIDPGFRTDGVVTMEVSLPASQYRMPPQKLGFFRRALESVGAQPGVRAVGLGSRLPFGDSFTTQVTLEGQTPEQVEANPQPQFQNVYGDFFQVLGLPLVEGRYFEAGDRMDSEPVVIVSAGLAERLWPGEEAVVGQRLRYSILRGNDWAQVVGVVGDIRFEKLAVEPAGDLYIPFPQLPMGGLNLFASVEGDPSATIPSIRQAIRNLDPNVPVEGLRRLETVVDNSIWLERLTSVLFTLLAGVALLLTLVGIYASIAYSVARRRREIGIRMAFGADRGSEMARVVRRAVTVASIGAVLGIAGAVLLARYLATLLFGLQGPELWSVGLAVVLLLAGAGLAALAPSWRAARLNPVTVLRSE